MNLELLPPKKAIKALLKQKPLRNEIDLFKTKLAVLLEKNSLIEKNAKDESEEHLKNNLRDFLRDTYYGDKYIINTKDRKDLVIHLDNTTNGDVAVIIEAKRLSNRIEMLTTDNLNKKALHELILYYLDERQRGNNQLKHLIATNVYEWFIFDANHFDKYIYRNPQIAKLYETKLNDHKDNPWFYEEIAKIISKSDEVIPCVYFDIRNFETFLKDKNKENDKELITLFKLFSPQHLLKQTDNNDSNSLNERFYRELLYIIGLEEVNEGNKILIRRKNQNRNSASLIELTIEALKTENPFHKIPDINTYGESREEQIFNISFELCITWINRILFLKLLEGQLLAYHKGNKEYCFLKSELINDFDELYKLFHKVLTVTNPERTEAIKAKYGRVPYLNSSLFEISELEDQTLKINSLDNNGKLELYNSTVLKEIKKKSDKLPTLNYLFLFLDAYDFSGEGNEDIQEENKTLINASVLGKVFEKLNGYKDGSIFTPGYITMYMCRQSIRPMVLQKFNEAFATKDNQKPFDTFEDIKNYLKRNFKTSDILNANTIVNSLRICDPAVGSGHFLVSALNEIIAIKAELGILADEKGSLLSEYEIDIVDDELIVTDSKGSIVEYKIINGRPDSKNIQRLQKTLFQEKQNIIENCLFGVDINPKSVLICRLRLWIELLKNAYYKEPDYTELETLPNIDINIKCGNSLLYRFPMDVDLSNVLRSLKYNIESYKGFVNSYKNEKNREVKRGLQVIIENIKKDFRREISKNSKEYQKLRKLQGKYALLISPDFFNNNEVHEADITYGSKSNKQKADERLKTLENEIKNLLKQLEENSAVHRGTFDWRFEFPEILKNTGEFEGFDIIIGNPPYIKEYENRNAFEGLRNNECYQGKMDLWYMFVDLGLKLLRNGGYLCFIATNNWVTNTGASNLRNIIIQKSKIEKLIDFGAFMVFENASIQTMIMLLKKDITTDDYPFEYCKFEGDNVQLDDVLNFMKKNKSKKVLRLTPRINREKLLYKPLTFNSDNVTALLEKIKAKQNFALNEKLNKRKKIKSEISQGIVAPQDFVNKASAQKLNGKFSVGEGIFVLSDSEFKSQKFSSKEKEIIKPYYTTDQLHRYYGDNQNSHWIIYTKSNINKLDKITKKIPIDNYPKIKQHLDKFKSVITSDFAPYGLHRAREQYFFEGEKIMATRKCPKQPVFTYTDFDCYVSQTFFIIKTNRINLKYLTGLLNSKLVAFWLRKKGKMQGNNYQIDKEPLLEIPIFKPSDKEQNEIAKLVDKIIALKAKGKDSSDIEKQIDEWVYQLYEITPQEQKLIEESLKN